jgi:HlyD family secretion protein
MNESAKISAMKSRQTKAEFASNSADYLAYELGKAVKELPPLYTRLLAGLVGVLVVGTIGWAAVSKTDEVAVTEGRISPKIPVQPVQLLQSGSIDTIVVKEGQQVKKDDVLVRFKSADVKAEIASIDRQMAFIKTQVARISTTAPKVKKERLRQVQVELQGLGKQLKSAQEKTTRVKKISDQGAVARQEYLDARDVMISYQAKIAEKNQEIRQLQQQDYQTNSGSLSDRNQLREKLIQLAGQKQQAEKRVEGLTLKAPVGGTIYSVKVAPAQSVIQAGQEVLTILPKQNQQGLILKVNVLNKDIGFISPGMGAKVKLETFSFQEFGTLEGKVIQVSPNGVMDEKLGVVFPTQIQLVRNSVKVRGKDIPIKPGMTATGEIVTRQRTILSFLLEPIAKRLDEAFSVR